MIRGLLFKLTVVVIKFKDIQIYTNNPLLIYKYNRHISAEIALSLLLTFPVLFTWLVGLCRIVCIVFCKLTKEALRVPATLSKVKVGDEGRLRRCLHG